MTLPANRLWRRQPHFAKQPTWPFPPKLGHEENFRFMIYSPSSIGITILGSGSRGNAMLIHSDGAGILIDAGFSLRELQRRLRAVNLTDISLQGIVISHEHRDHVSGLRVCANHFQTPIFTTRRCAEALRQQDPKLGHLSLFAAGSSFAIGAFQIEPFSVPHDANDPVAFIIRHGNCKIGVATDLGYAGQTVEYMLRQCNTIVLESNHDMNMLAAAKRPWPLKQRIMGRHGHLSNENSAELLKKVVDQNTSHVILAHISQECNQPELAENTVRKGLSQINRDDVKLIVTSQEKPTKTVWNKIK